jgi:hypothetical protein
MHIMFIYIAREERTNAKFVESEFWIWLWSNENKTVIHSV